MRHDRDRQVRWPVADAFHLQADGRLQFFTGFRRLLQAGSLTARNGTTAFGYPRERMSLNSGRDAFGYPLQAPYFKRRAVVQPVKDFAGRMFQHIGYLSRASLPDPRLLRSSRHRRNPPLHWDETALNSLYSSTWSSTSRTLAASSLKLKGLTINCTPLSRRP